MEMPYTEKLSKCILVAAALLIAFFTLRYFGSVVGYIVFALVVSLIAKPLKSLLKKVKIKNKTLPDWLLSIISILLLLLILNGLLACLIPVVTLVVTDISNATGSTGNLSVSAYLTDLNRALRNTFKLGPSFKIEVEALNQLKSLLSFDLFGNMIGTVATTIGSVGIGIFSVVFISFFLIKDDTLMSRLVLSLIPDKLISESAAAMADLERLLSRYFLGLLIEMLCVAIIDFLGLWTLARLDFFTALGIGFIAGLMNIIPYLGPVIGGVLGGLMSLVIKFCGEGYTGDVSLWMFLVILICVFVAAQLVDNIVLQPLIYSTSIQAKPLEIFIVMLLAGCLGGIVGMLLAIPGYTVIRVIAIHFMPDNKFIKFLTS